MEISAFFLQWLMLILLLYLISLTRQISHLMSQKNDDKMIKKHTPAPSEENGDQKQKQEQKKGNLKVRLNESHTVMTDSNSHETTPPPPVPSPEPPLPSAQKSQVNDHIDPASYGYVFLLFGDITQINCDCWLGSGGAALDVRHLPFFPESANLVTIPYPTEATGTAQKSIDWQKAMYSKLCTYAPWPENLPVPYTIHLRSNRTTEYFVRDTERFLRVAAEDIHNRNGKKLRKNVCPLLAMPLIGTGFGGNFSKTGEMMKSVLPLLYALAEELRVDIALVFIEKEVFSLAQAVRIRFLSEQPKHSALYRRISGRRYLQQHLLEKIPFLASQAAQGELTLFIGAGVSMGAGLPSWDQLLSNIAKKLNFTTEELKEFEKLDYYSRAAILEQTIETRKDPMKRKPSRKLTFQESFEQVMREMVSGSAPLPPPAAAFIAPQGESSKEPSTASPFEMKSLYDMVAEETQGRGYTVMHSLIASLPVKEVRGEAI
jgi:hypothetical protein